MRLADFDPQVVAEYDITDKVLDRVVRYLQLLQGPDALALEDIALGGYYGTAALLHEVVELKVLLGREPRLLEMDRDTILAFWPQGCSVLTQNAQAPVRSAELTTKPGGGPCSGLPFLGNVFAPKTPPGRGLRALEN